MGWNLKTASRTNSSPDHIGPGECRDLAHYKACKAELFAHSKNSVINIDDPLGDYFIKSAKGRVLTYGMNAQADYQGDRYTIRKVKLSLRYPVYLYI